MDNEMTPLLRDSLFLLGAKRTMFQDHKASIDTLVIGSSHGDFGFDPSFFPGAFNMCCRSQDLKYAYLLYEHLTAQAPNIRQVALFYSVFSSGNWMEKASTESEICPALNELFGLGLHYEDPKLGRLAQLIEGRLDQLRLDIEGTRGFIPQLGKGFSPASYGAQNRANDHMKLNKQTDANIWLIKLLQKIRQKGQKFCVVLPPVRSDYKAATGGKTQTLFAPLLQILKDEGLNDKENIINAFDDDGFKDDYFGDYDHLLPLGEGTHRLSCLLAQHFGASAPSSLSSLNPL